MGVKSFLADVGETAVALIVGTVELVVDAIKAVKDFFVRIYKKITLRNSKKIMKDNGFNKALVEIDKTCSNRLKLRDIETGHIGIIEGTERSKTLKNGSIIMAE